MKCEKNEKGECNENCKNWQIRLKEPNKYACMTFALGLYGYNTILVDIEKNKELFEELFK